MSHPRPEIRWPIYVTVWCFVAATYAAKDDSALLVVMAALQVVVIWGLYATSRPREEAER